VIASSTEPVKPLSDNVLQFCRDELIQQLFVENTNIDYFLNVLNQLGEEGIALISQKLIRENWSDDELTTALQNCAALTNAHPSYHIALLPAYLYLLAINYSRNGASEVRDLAYGGVINTSALIEESEDDVLSRARECWGPEVAKSLIELTKQATHKEETAIRVFSLMTIGIIAEWRSETVYDAIELFRLNRPEGRRLPADYELDADFSNLMVVAARLNLPELLAALGNQNRGCLSRSQGANSGERVANSFEFDTETWGPNILAALAGPTTPFLISFCRHLYLTASSDDVGGPLDKFHGELRDTKDFYSWYEKVLYVVGNEGLTAIEESSVLSHLYELLEGPYHKAPIKEIQHILAFILKHRRDEGDEFWLRQATETPERMDHFLIKQGGYPNSGDKRDLPNTAEARDLFASFFGYTLGIDEKPADSDLSRLERFLRRYPNAEMSTEVWQSKKSKKIPERFNELVSSGYLALSTFCVDDAVRASFEHHDTIKKDVLAATQRKITALGWAASKKTALRTLLFTNLTEETVDNACTPNRLFREGPRRRLAWGTLALAVSANIRSPESVWPLVEKYCGAPPKKKPPELDVVVRALVERDPVDAAKRLAAIVKSHPNFYPLGVHLGHNPTDDAFKVIFGLTKSEEQEVRLMAGLGIHTINKRRQDEDSRGAGLGFFINRCKSSPDDQAPFLARGGLGDLEDCSALLKLAANGEISPQSKQAALLSALRIIRNYRKQKS
jgi:hypothetical protein